MIKILSEKNQPKINCKSVENFWDEKAKKGSFINAGGFSSVEFGEIRHACELRKLLKRVPFNKNQIVLELGCGSGRWTVDLSSLVKEIIGVDLSQNQLDLAQKEINRRKIKNVKLIKKNVLEYSSDKKFDIIYLSGVLQYLDDEDFKKIIKTCKKMLNSNGTIITRDTYSLFKKHIKSHGYYQVIYRKENEAINFYQSEGFYQIHGFIAHFIFFEMFFQKFNIIPNNKVINILIYVEKYFITLYYPFNLLFNFYKIIFNNSKVNWLIHKFYIFKLKE